MRIRIPLFACLLGAATVMAAQAASEAATSAASKASSVATKVEGSVKTGVKKGAGAVEHGAQVAGKAVSNTAKKLGLPTQPASATKPPQSAP